MAHATLRFGVAAVLLAAATPLFAADPAPRVRLGYFPNVTHYDMIHPRANDTATVGSVFVIGPDDRIALTLAYPASTGRNFDEVLRVVDSLQLTAVHAVATPANWRDGDDVIIVPSLSDEQAHERFPQGWTAHTPYLPVVPQPGR